MNRRSFLRQAAAAITAVAIPVKLATAATRPATPAILGHQSGDEIVSTIGIGGDYPSFDAWQQAWHDHCGGNLIAAKKTATAIFLKTADPQKPMHVHGWRTEAGHGVRIVGTLDCYYSWPHGGMFAHNLQSRYIDQWE